MKDQYFELFIFFGSWFPDMDFDGLNEEAIVKKYKKTEKRELIHKVILQAQKFKKELINKQSLINILIKETNIYFETKFEADTWLDKIIKLLIDEE